MANLGQSLKETKETTRSKEEGQGSESTRVR